METASEYLRRTDKQNEAEYAGFNKELVGLVRNLISDGEVTINWDFSDQKLGDDGKSYGTLYRVDYNGEKSAELYKRMVTYHLNKDTITRNFENSLKNGEVIPLGDAIVADGSVKVNPNKQTYYIDEVPVISVFFNLLLPEQLEDEEDSAKDEDDE